MNALKYQLKRFRNFDQHFGKEGAEEISDVIDLAMEDFKTVVIRTGRQVTWAIIAATTLITTLLTIIALKGD
jgi:hypothetical protein